MLNSILHLFDYLYYARTRACVCVCVTKKEGNFYMLLKCIKALLYLSCDPSSGRIGQDLNNPQLYRNFDAK